MARVNIGGQAVLEGVMMKGKNYYAVAVRKADGSIVCETKECRSIAERIKLFRLPLFRGMLVFVESLILGIKSLNFSARHPPAKPLTKALNSCIIIMYNYNQ